MRKHRCTETSAAARFLVSYQMESRTTFCLNVCYDSIHYCLDNNCDSEKVSRVGQLDVHFVIKETSRSMRNSTTATDSRSKTVLERGIFF